ncbi:MFS transporter [Streptomyces mexicanus]|jgi:EmrB/QacA subfamily drug resistance transporter|uniref:MFS transporter n=1 Tax=Streptomyces mexicanus TaxID=178566 RepID=A0A7X1I194_9ACTN|nr:MFS transporter [Streptomyces mexicanus]MBC2866864.1 MFS transporter [Streptomyces mexicanus]
MTAVPETSTSAAYRSTGVPAPPAAPVRSPRHTAFALAAVCLGFFMILLDGSALNIALPAIERDVHGSMAALQWVVTIYTIPLASVLLTAGSISDRWGARRLFVFSLAGFTAASLLCAVSPNLSVLVVARFLQGIAAGGLLPTTLTIIARTYPDPIERAKAITVWGATGGLALVAGPIGGGVLTELLGWRSIFLINVPVGLITLYLAQRYAAETLRRASRPDLPGQLTGIAALSAIVAYLIEGGSLGWASPLPLSLLALAAVAAAVFLVVEARTSHPMLPLAVFRRAAFSASIINGFAFQFGGYGMQFMLAIYLQQQWGLSAERTGLYFLPFSVAWVFGTIVLNRRLVHRGPRFLLWTGALSSFIGAVLLLGVDDQGTWPLFVLGTALAGLGCGVFSPSLNAAALLAIDPAYAGLGSGVLNTARQVGMAMGVALLGSLIGMHDTLLGLRVSVVLVALCFFAIIGLSVAYVPRKETA